MTNQRSGPSQTPPTALLAYGDGAAGGRIDEVTSSSSLGSTSFSPIANRTRQNQQQGDVITAPMINVMGPTGPALVYRPWTDSDMTEALTHLPDPRNSGIAFALQFETFCREFMPTVSEIRRLLMKKLGPTDFAKIRQHCGGDLRLTSPNWGDVVNAAYVNALNTFLNALRTTFPNTIDMSKLFQTCQGPADKMALTAEPTSLYQEESGVVVDMAMVEASLDDSHWPEMSVSSADKKDIGQRIAPSGERRGRQELSLPTEKQEVKRGQTERRRSDYSPRIIEREVKHIHTYIHAATKNRLN